MTPLSNSDPNLVAAVTELTESVESLRADIQADRRTIGSLRRNDKMLALSLLLDLVLSIALGLVGLQARHAGRAALAATSVAQVQQNNLRVLCDSGNESRAAQRKLWEGVLALSGGPKPGESEVQRLQREEQTKAFRVLLDDATAQRNCTKATR